MLLEHTDACRFRFLVEPFPLSGLLAYVLYGSIWFLTSLFLLIELPISLMVPQELCDFSGVKSSKFPCSCQLLDIHLVHINLYLVKSCFIPIRDSHFCWELLSKFDIFQMFGSKVPRNHISNHFTKSSNSSIRKNPVGIPDDLWYLWYIWYIFKQLRYLRHVWSRELMIDDPSKAICSMSGIYLPTFVWVIFIYLGQMLGFIFQHFQHHASHLGNNKHQKNPPMIPTNPDRNGESKPEGTLL